MLEVQFALIREGSSDDGLVAHIRTLLLRFGAFAAVGAPRQYKGPTRARLAQVWKEPDRVDLIFVHRDADEVNPASRYEEIRAAAVSCGIPPQRVISVVPVQELEAWLLADPDAVRSVVGRPNGRSSMALPKVSRIEATSSPKECLAAACIAASETTGARRVREVKRFPERRAALLDRLNIDGAVSHLPSWQRFVSDLRAAVECLSDRDEHAP